MEPQPRGNRRPVSWVYDLPRPRCQAWDSYLDDQVLALVADQVTEARARHAAAARTMVDKVAERLTEVDPSELSVSELARWIDVAVKVERLALGDAGQILETREVDVTAEVESRRERARSVIDTSPRSTSCSIDSKRTLARPRNCSKTPTSWNGSLTPPGMGGLPALTRHHPPAIGLFGRSSLGVAPGKLEPGPSGCSTKRSRTRTRSGSVAPSSDQRSEIPET